MNASRPFAQPIRRSSGRFTASLAAPLLALTLLTSLMVGAIAAPAGAELSDGSEPVGGVAGIMPSQSNNFGSPVWALETIGNTMYVGGKFTSLTSGPGGQSTQQAALAAMDSRNGQWISSFQPDVRGGSVFAIAASPDGSRLFIGGDFTSVEGAADTAGLAAVDPITGDLDPTWRAGLERPWTTDNPVARAIDIQNGWVYVGGTFTHVRSGSSYQQHLRVARVALATGAPDATFDPVISGGGVWDIDPSPDGSRLYVAGFFTSVNSDTTNGDRFAAVQTGNGDLVGGLAPFEPNLEQTGRQYAVVATDSKVFVAGEEHLLQVLDANTLTREQVYYTGTNPDSGAWALSGGGDFQVLELVGDRVYAGCHCWSQHLNPSTGAELFPTVAPNPGVWTPVRGLLTYDANTGAHLADVTFDMSGASGPWAISEAADECLWVGGQMTRSAGNWLGNLARFCDEANATDVERPSTPKGLADDGSTPSSIEISWQASTDNVGVTGYEVHRSTNGLLGPVIATTTDTNFADTTATAGTTYTYAIKAVDAAGNTSWRSNYVSIEAGVTIDTERPSAPRGLSSSLGAGSVDLTWLASTDDVGVTGYEIYRSTNGSLGSVIATTTNTTYSDTSAAAGTTYTYAIKAVDAAGNTSWRSNQSTITNNAGADTQRPSTPTGLTASVSGDDVTFSWNASTDDVGVTSYQVVEIVNGSVAGIATTSNGTTVVLDDVADGTSRYAVRALDAAGNASWRSNTVTVAIG